MTSIVKTYSFPVEKINIIEEFSIIVERDKTKLKVRNDSQMIVKLIEDFVRKHRTGNPQQMLSAWEEEPTFMALPTMGQMQPPEKLDAMDELDFDDYRKASTARYEETMAAEKRRGYTPKYVTRPEAERLAEKKPLASSEYKKPDEVL